MKYLFITWFILYTQFSYCQTCVIAKKTKKAIYIGADSRLVLKYTYTDMTTKTDTASMCKIYSEGKYNFATSGMSINESPQYIKEACKKGGSFDEVILRYSNSFREWINNDMVRLSKLFGLSEFSALVKKCQPYYCNAIFWGIDGDSLYMAMATFVVELDKLWNFKVSSSLVKGDALPAGHYNNIFNKLYKPETWRGNIPKVIRSLIQEEINANVMEVGGQIHVLKFTKKDGLVWVGGKNPPCN